jgi:hypothetical protein
VTFEDGFPGVLLARLDVRQARRRLARWQLPALAAEPCPPAQIGPGRICRQPVDMSWRDNLTAAEGGALDAAGEVAAEGVGGASPASPELLHTLGPREVVAQLPSSWSRAAHGSRLLNFSFPPATGLEAPGRCGRYPADGAPLEPAGAAAGEAEWDLGSPDAAACGSPCERGVARLALAEWLDGGTAAVVATTAVLSPAGNAFATARAVLEFPPSGGVFVSSAVHASSLQPWPRSGPDARFSTTGQLLTRVVPEALLALLVALDALYLLASVFYVPRLRYSSSSGTRISFRKREGSLATKVRETAPPLPLSHPLVITPPYAVSPHRADDARDSNVKWLTLRVTLGAWGRSERRWRTRLCGRTW